MIGLALKSAVAVIGCLILGDLAGMIFLVVVEVLPFDVFSGALTYVVWFVFGIFVGLFSFNFAGAWGAARRKGDADWTSLPQAKQMRWVIVPTQAAVIVGLAVLFYRLYWSQGVAGDYYVPDSAPHSITYFVAVLGSIVAGSIFLMPTPDTSTDLVR